MYQGFRSHYPRRCLLVGMNECQRKFPQMWHSRRLPFHNKDNCRSHSNQWLYSFQGSRERQNIAKSRLIKSKTVTRKSQCAKYAVTCYELFFIQLTSWIGIEKSAWYKKLRFSCVIGSTRNNDDSLTIIFERLIIAGGRIPTIRCNRRWATGSRINQGLHSCCIL